MSIPLEQVQSALANLPPHIIHVDLLVFRRVELESPTPWIELAQWSVLLVEAISRLREELPGAPRSWAHAPLTGDPPPIHLSHLRFDTLTPAMLRTAFDGARDRVTSCADGPLDPAREQLAALIEERLHDLLLEIGYGIRRQRRAPRLPGSKNPLARSVLVARSALRPEVARLFATMASQIGPLPFVGGEPAGGTNPAPEEAHRVDR